MDWVRNHIRRLHCVLRRRGWQRHDAEDVIQDAFLRMQAFCNEGGEVRNSEAFLVRTAINLAVNSRTREPVHSSLAEHEEQPWQTLNFAPAPEDILTAEESLERVMALLETLTSRTREIFLLRYVDGYTYPQIARQLNISVSAIEKHMARAMLVLTKELSGDDRQ